MDKETFPNIIDLNVGGKYLTTTLETLTKEPDSMLASMFSGRHTLVKDRYNRVFIDCDSKIFVHILNYLRSGALPPGELAISVYDIAMYYGIETLVKRLQNHHSVQYRKRIYFLRDQIDIDEYERLKQDVDESISKENVSLEGDKILHVVGETCESSGCLHNEKTKLEDQITSPKQNIVLVTSCKTSENMFSDIIMLNVGGKIMATMLCTLQKEPNSQLAAMTCGYNTISKDKDGRCFIDCDHKVFRHVLQYLRFDLLPPINKSVDVYKLAKHYLIHSLIHQLEMYQSVQYHTLIENAKAEVDSEQFETIKGQIIDKITGRICSYDGISLHIWVKHGKGKHKKVCVKRHQNASDRNGRTYGIVVETEVDMSEAMKSYLVHDLCELGYGKNVDAKRQCQHKCNCFEADICSIVCHRIELSHVVENHVYHDIPMNNGIRCFLQKVKELSDSYTLS